jgi:hypothetical protein
LAGYSQTPLPQKLGIKPGFRLILLSAPEGYERTLGALPPGVTIAEVLDGRLDFVQFFATSRVDLARRFPELKGALKDAGMLWISWPKRTSQIATDLSEDVVREIGLAEGLVDVKVCAVDESWSALKFVYRLRDRG